MNCISRVLIGPVLLLILIFPEISAQNDDKEKGGMRIGISGGLSLCNFKGRDFWGEKLDNKLILGYHGEVNANIRLIKSFYFQPGLLFTVKGARKEIIELPFKGDDNTVVTSIRLTYIELPLCILYKPKLGNGHFILGFGPYVSYAFKGKVKTSGANFKNEMNVRFRNEVKIGDPSSYAYYRPLDTGINIFSGYELPAGIFFQLNVQLGFLRINPSFELLTNDRTSFNNTGFGISSGYRF